MHLNTIKTVWGFLLSMLGKYTPLKFEGQAIEDVYNYQRINDTLSTSGQPTAKQFAWIREAGYTTVINLLPHNAENALKDEAALLASLSLRYVHIPVSFNNPTDEDFKQFVSSMQAASGEKVWVHCAANARVSAFVYRYRCAVLGEDEQRAKADMQKIWEPFGAWKRFVSEAGTKELTQ